MAPVLSQDVEVEEGECGARRLASMDRRLQNTFSVKYVRSSESKTAQLGGVVSGLSFGSSSGYCCMWSCC